MSNTVWNMYLKSLKNLVSEKKLMNGFCLFFYISGDIQELYETNLKPGHAAAFSEDCDSASSKGIVRGAGNQVGNTFLRWLFSLI